MIATITYTRRPFLVRLARPIAVRFLRAWVREEEEYIAQLRAGGVLTEPEIAERAKNIAPLRVRLALWERS